MFETLSTYRPRTATKLDDDEIAALTTALAGLTASQAVKVSREPRDSEGKARTDANAVRLQFQAIDGRVLRTHVLGTEGEYYGAVSNPLAPATTDDTPEPTGVEKLAQKVADAKAETPADDGNAGDPELDPETGQPIADTPKRRRRTTTGDGD